jgi:hypothetical protein
VTEEVAMLKKPRERAVRAAGDGCEKPERRLLMWQLPVCSEDMRIFVRGWHRS